ncbi:MAG: rRNA cytosine-C5-methyltransferase [Dysgonamonadaceae bacterium]|jgi:16S rRNA C967 or C1407 C5-methylase (RsmB/RsmF family)/NOL1/NOP2/fmu family ribosome biogenesis protein|nr:rRNA cytosine-C5-methyltransferase [Dysgonamonadaceae bacterium]
MKLPAAFVSQTQALLGKEWQAFEKALQAQCPVSIRLNPYKSSEDVLTPFKPVEMIPWASNAYYLPFRPSFTHDPLFHAGCYYVQEASSMFLEQMVGKHITQPVKVLDLCAAPGGKATQLASVLPEGSLLVANEVVRSRAGILTENIVKWGTSHTLVTNNDPSAVGKCNAFFDVIVADVPCSGEGMFRKDAGAIAEWSVHTVRLCAERQKRILADVWQALKPGGLLIYSTCTYNRSENEDILSWICNELKAGRVGEPHRFLPHQTKGEGFFIAALRKDESGKTDENNRRNDKKTKKSSFPQEVKSWLTGGDDFCIFPENNLLKALPSIHSEDYLFLKSRLKILSAGTFLAEIKGKELIPAHALAMSASLDPAAFPRWELDKETALKYLRREALQTNTCDLPKGYLLVTRHNHPLGFVKNIGVRANNLYPQEWRIRTSGVKAIR